jgi:hypothetical protein
VAVEPMGKGGGVVSIIKADDPVHDAIKDACEVLEQEANNLACASTYEDAGFKKSQIPYRAGSAINREIRRLRAIKDRLITLLATPNEVAQRCLQLERIAEWSESAMSSDEISEAARKAFEQIHDEATREVQT